MGALRREPIIAGTPVAAKQQSVDGVRAAGELLEPLRYLGFPCSLIGAC